MEMLISAMVVWTLKVGGSIIVVGVDQKFSGFLCIPIIARKT